MKTTVTERKNALDGIDSRLDGGRNQWFGTRGRENHPSGTAKRISKNEGCLRGGWDNIKHENICIVRVPEGEEKKQETENLFEEIIIENFPNLAEEKDTQIQEMQRVPNKMNPRRPTSRQI